MSTKALVTLTALTGDIIPKVRTFELDSRRPNIQVGRSSKSPAKGIQSAGNNAWFNSPVMSRNHAIIMYDAQEKSIKLQDVGSMHGTQLNEERLPKNEAVTITSGDRLIFGAEVQRGLESFPPCVFLVKCKTRHLPEHVYDISSEEDEKDNISDFDEGNYRSSSDAVSIESPLAKLSSATKAIDLTRDGSIANDVWKAGERLPAHKVIADSAVDLTREETPMIPSSIAEENSDVDESSNMPTSKDQYDHPRSHQMNVIRRGYSYGIDSRDSDVEDDFSISVEEEAPESCHGVDSDDAISTNEYSAGESEDDDQYQETIVNLVASKKTHPSSVDDRADDDDFQALEAAGVETLFVGGSTNSKTTQPPYSDKLASLSGVNAQSTTMLSAVNMERQPSPSDAAMVKTSPKPLLGERSPKQSQVPAHQSPELDLETHRVTAQSLGDKTGKHSFFEAREGNRAQFRPSPDDYHLHSWNIIPDTYEGNQSYITRSHYKTFKDMDCASGEAGYLAISPEPEMVNADKCNETNSITRKGVPSPPARGLRINDIIHSSSASGAKSLKRKIGKVSDSSDEEARAWTEMARSFDPKPCDNTSPEKGYTQIGKTGSPKNMTIQVTESRPAKRMKTFMNAALKVTAGIAVGGASVFGLLAATAPSFA